MEAGELWNVSFREEVEEVFEDVSFLLNESKEK